MGGAPKSLILNHSEYISSAKTAPGDAGQEADTRGFSSNLSVLSFTMCYLLLPAFCWPNACPATGDNLTKIPALFGQHKAHAGTAESVPLASQSQSPGQKFPELELLDYSSELDSMPKFSLL